MNNTEHKRLVMIQYALKLVNLALENNYILYYRDLECRNIVWDCQQALLEWDDSQVPSSIKEEFFTKDILAYSYSRQLLNIALSAILVKDASFNHITLSDLNKIVLI